MKLPCAFVLALMLAVSVRAQAPKPEEAAQTAAEAWLTLVDDGKFDDSWTVAAEPVQKLVTREQWSKGIGNARSVFGKLESRKLKSAQLTHKLPGAPDGDYVVLQFDTSFEHKKNAVETITPMKSPDGSWKVSGYYIK